MNEADNLARRVADRLRAQEGTSVAWNIEIEEVREGYARVAMVVRDDKINGHAIAHGGMIFALADTAFAYACNLRNVESVAQNATIAFLAPGGLGDRLVAEAQEQALSGRSGVYGVQVRYQKDEKIAVFRGLSRTIGGKVLPDD